MAELLMRAALPAGPPVASAGTWTPGGEGLWPAAAAELARLGVPTIGFASRRVEPSMVADADLVLTATRAHRDALVAASPAVWRRTFTWRELAWLLHGVDRSEIPGRSPGERLPGLAAVAVARRGHSIAPAPALLDVADPVGGPADAVARAAALIQEALKAPLQLL